MNQLSEKDLAAVEEVAQKWVTGFEKDLPLEQNLIMACLGLTEKVSDALADKSAMAAVARLVGGRADDIMSGLLIGLALSAHDPAMAGAMLEMSSTSQKAIMIQPIELTMKRIWELVHDAR